MLAEVDKTWSIQGPRERPSLITPIILSSRLNPLDVYSPSDQQTLSPDDLRHGAF